MTPWDHREEIDHAAQRLYELWPLYETPDKYCNAVKEMATSYSRHDVGKTCRDNFFDQITSKLIGELSWRRLCHEFVWVLLNVRMVPVSEDEIENCSSSSRATFDKAAPEDIVWKLVKHRHCRTTKRSIDIFIKRMLMLLERDIEVAMRMADIRETHKKKAMTDALLGHIEFVSRSVTDQIECRLDDMEQRFALSFRNGRVDLINQKLWPDSQDGSTSGRVDRPIIVDRSAGGLELKSSLPFYIALTTECPLLIAGVANVFKCVRPSCFVVDDDGCGQYLGRRSPWSYDFVDGGPFIHVVSSTVIGASRLHYCGAL